jgi:catechol 2,3-dioxygenase-like lactoylglutathione lyase family enzyme
MHEGGAVIPDLDGVLETSLYVEDLERSATFYQTVFGFEKMLADSRFCAFAVGDGQVLLLFRRGASGAPSAIPGGTIPGHDGSGTLHLAFSIPAAGLEPWRRWLDVKGVSVESEVTWPRGGRSLYFRDPDGHLVELVTPGCWKIY